MKYWLVTTEFPPIHGGGISTYCWHTAQMLQQNGDEVTVFVNDSSVRTEKVEKVGKNIRVVRFSFSDEPKAMALGYDARLSIEFSRIVGQFMELEGTPDVLETQDYLGIGYYIQQKKHLLYPNFKSLKVVVTVHAPSFLYLDYNQVPLYKFPTYWTGQMEKASIMMADLVLSPSNYILEEIRSRLRVFDKKPVRIFNPFSQKQESLANDQYDDLVFFGKLTPQKGCLEMLSYLSKMWDSGFKKPISIIGGGAHFFYPVGEDMNEYIQKRYSRYIKQSLIRFEGNLPPSKLKERLKKAGIIIIPSIVDNFPYAVLEAMNLGKVIMCSTNGGHIEILEHKKNAFLFDHNTERSFEKSLNNALSTDHKELESIGRRAKLTVEKHCNYQTIYSQKMTAISKMVNESSSSNHYSFIENISKSKSSSSNKFNADLLSIVVPFYNLGDYLEENNYFTAKH